MYREYASAASAPRRARATNFRISVKSENDGLARAISPSISYERTPVVDH
jgi:hypothetical protein